jgi:dimethylargininase
MTMPGAALVRRPGPGVPEAAAGQWTDYVALLADAGWSVHTLPPAGNALEDCFIADTLAVVDGTALLARNDRGLKKAVRDLGLAVTRLDPPAVLHGSDVIYAPGPLESEPTVYVGRSGRSTDDAACEIARRACGPAVRVVQVAMRDLPCLSAGMTVLPEGTPIGLPDHVDTSALPGLRVPPEAAGAHVAVLGERLLLLSEAAPRTVARLRADGYTVRTVEIEALEAAGGTVNRLSVLIDC